MLVTQMYSGQGLGNQLWLYVVTRTKALDIGAEFGIMSPENFKAFSFLEIDFGKLVLGGTGPEGGPPSVLPNSISKHYSEPQNTDPRTSLNSNFTDLEFSKISDNTKIDGVLQNEDYILHRKEEIRNWLKFNGSEVREEIRKLLNENICIINFRGGEYRHMKDVFLPKSYWLNARKEMLKSNKKIKFVIISDDPDMAQLYFKKSEVIETNMAEDYFLINNAKYLIISNSSFAWFPAWLNLELKKCIAPKFWWGYNKNIHWSCGYSLTRGWEYLDKSGLFTNYAVCREEIHKSQNNEVSKGHQIKIVWSNIVQFFLDLPVKTLLWLGIKRRRRSRTVVHLDVLVRKLTGKRVLDLRNRIIRRISQGQFSLNEFPIISPFKGSRWLTQERKSRLVIDAFYFFNEIELLEARLNILDEHVDYFLLLESKQTYMGQNKPLIFKENPKLFEKFKNKIVYFEIPTAPIDRASAAAILHGHDQNQLQKLVASRSLIDKNVPPGDSAWITEFYQKESMIDALSQFPLNSLIFISDLDEIWNPEAFFRLKTSSILVFKQIPLIYYMNCKSDESWRNWTGTILVELETLVKNGVNASRTHNRLKRNVVVNGGWHFSYQGGKSKVLEKLEAVPQEEFNTKIRRENLENSLRNLTDIRDVKAKLIKSDEDLPAYLSDFKRVHPDWFLV